MQIISPELTVDIKTLDALETTLDFSSGDRFFEQTAITAPLVFTVSQTLSPKLGASIWLHLTADGVEENIPDFSAFTELRSSAGWDNTASTLNLVQITYTGLGYYFVISQPAGIASGGGGQTFSTLTFPDRTANISEDAGGLTATNASYTDTWAAGGSYLEANTDGWFGFTIADRTQSNNILIGFKSSPALGGLSTYEFFCWTGSSYDYKYGFNGDASNPTTDILSQDGHMMRLARISGTVLAQYSADGGDNWTTFYNYGASSIALYPMVNMGNPIMADPVSFGMTAR